MDKKGKFYFTIITSIFALLPMVMGVILWNQLPDALSIQMATGGAFGGFGPKWVVVFVLPLIFTLAHLICLRALMSRDDIIDRMGVIAYLGYIVCPVLSLISGINAYGTALGWF